jgi:hypothetical protein
MPPPPGTNRATALLTALDTIEQRCQFVLGFKGSYFQHI